MKTCADNEHQWRQLREGDTKFLLKGQDFYFYCIHCLKIMSRSSKEKYPQLDTADIGMIVLAVDAAMPIEDMKIK